METAPNKTRGHSTTSSPATTNAKDFTAPACAGQPPPTLKSRPPTPDHHPEFSDRGKGAGGGKRSHPEGGSGLKIIEISNSGPSAPAGADGRYWRPVRLGEIIGAAMAKIVSVGGRP